jgi:hypothetical protein
MPRRKRAATPAFSLFSFQDIISCVMGIMILVTLILALEVIDGGEAKQVSDVQDRIAANRAIISQLQVEIDRMRAALQEAATVADGVIGVDPVKLAEDAQVLREQVAKLEKQLAEQQSTGSALQQEITKTNQELAAKTVEKDRQAVAQQREAAAAESRLKTILQSDVVVFRDPPKRTFLIIEVTRQGYLAALYGKVQAPVTCGTLSELGSHLDDSEDLNPVLYFIVKPSGHLQFETARALAQKRGMQFSFTLMGENAKVIDPIEGHIH